VFSNCRPGLRDDLAKAGVLFRAKLPLAEAGGNLWRKGRYLMVNFNILKKEIFHIKWAEAHFT
jgi:hypothetical protein